MNTQGQFDIRYSIYWVVILGIATITVFAIALLLSGYIAQLTKQPAPLQSSLIASRFGTMPECFAYQYADGTVKQQSIDIFHFTNEQMARCYTTPQEKGYKTFNFRVKLLKHDKEIASNNYFYQDADDLTLFRDVDIWNGTAFISDTMAIYVQERIGS